MNAGERAIAKEQKRLEKERKRRIELANKMLIPVGGKTKESLKLLAFDPEGVFRFEDNRWLKVYEIVGAYSGLADVTADVLGRMRITFYLSENGRETCHLTLMETGEIYEEIRQKIAADESVLAKVCELKPLNVDETMNQIAANFCQDLRFSYASFVRGKKDWKKECFFEAECEEESFKVGRIHGQVLGVLEFPKEVKRDLISNLKELSCPMFVSLDLNGLTEEEQLNFKRALEKKFNRRLPLNEAEEFINLSLSITLLCDSKDARRIVKETLILLLLQEGFVTAPCFLSQNQALESGLSLGFSDYTVTRNASKELVQQMLGGKSHDAKEQI